jgi:lipoate---protein ligase
LIGASLFAEGQRPFDNLALEEALLERGDCREGLLLFYVNSPCVIVGRNQNPWAEVSPRSGLSVLRRVSGGGAVYQDGGNLNWAFIVPREAHDHEAELDLVAKALRDLGIDVARGPRGGLFVASGSHAGCKLSGTARRLSARKVLHHGTLLVDADLAALGSCLGGLEPSNTRALSSVGSPCVNLAALAPLLSVELVASHLSSSIASRAPERFKLGMLGSDDERSYAAEASRRLRSWEWTWASTPPFSLSLRSSRGPVSLEVKSGLVASASGPGEEFLYPLIGRRFDYDMPDSCLSLLEAGGSR